MTEPSEGARRVQELRAARTAWHEDFGVPISEEYARFLTAIGEVEDYVIDRETHSAEMRKALEKLLERIDVIGSWGAGVMQCDDVAVELGRENIAAARAALKGGAL